MVDVPNIGLNEDARENPVRRSARRAVMTAPRGETAMPSGHVRLMLLYLLLTAAVTVSTSLFAEPSPQRTMIITDIRGIQTEISRYGIVYHPLGSPTLFDAYTQGIIVERGESGVTVPWDGIERVEITGWNATILLTDGEKIGGARLRAGTLVGENDIGREMFEELRDLETIEFKD